jgi:hypothetical protein
VAGTFFRRSRVGRYVHSYNEDGTVAAVMKRSPARCSNGSLERWRPAMRWTCDGRD